MRSTQHSTILIFDPAEAAPEPGLAPDPMVRLYDPARSPVDPWTVREWRHFQLVSESRAAREALEVYARREVLRQQAMNIIQQQQERVRRAAEYERRRQESVQRQRFRQQEIDQRRAAQAAAERERLDREHAESMLKRSLLAEAKLRYRDAESADEELEVFELELAGHVRLRLAALLDPGAKQSSRGLAVFCPAHPEGPLASLSPPEWQVRTTLGGKRRRDLVARFRAWQAEQRRLVHTAGLVKTYEAAIERACSALLRPVENRVPLHDLPLAEDDLRLAMLWCRDDDPALHRDLSRRLRKHGWQIDALRRELEGMPYDERPESLYLLTRMLSARLAEVAVREFYQKRDPALSLVGRRMVDMSIRQVTGEVPFDHAFDLAYPEDSRPPDLRQDPPRRLDVKNARIRPGDPTYTRHYVKRLRVLPGGAAVVIVGVVTEVDRLIHLLRRSPDDGHVRVLGETDRAKVEELERIYQLATLKLNLTRAGTEGQFFPPWMFDAPAFTVAERTSALDGLRSAHSACPADATSHGAIPVPLAIAAGIPITDAQASRLTTPQLALVRELARMEDSRRRSLPHLYLTVLREFIGLLSAPERLRAEYRPELYREVLFLDGAETSPLGIPDPLKSVASLLSSLGHLLRYGWERLLQFESFEFQRAGVLYAWHRGNSGEKWTLMFTHCGNHHNCGGTHLVVGRESLCRLCRHLACRACNYCQQGCNDNLKPLHERKPAGVAETA